MNILQKQLEEYKRTPDGRVIQGANHTSKILSHKYRNKIIMDSYKHLKQYSDQYDAIACCGISGLTVVPQVAELLNKNILVVRKQINGYSNFIIEGASTHNYIIIDDLVCSGGTIKHIIKNIKEEMPRAKCMGVWSYIREECAYRTMPENCIRDLGIKYL